MEVGGDSVEYVPADNEGQEISFLKWANESLKSVNVSLNFPAMQSLNGQSTIPKFRTTQEQLNNFVPYIEYIRSGENVTGFTWRIVNPQDTSTPIAPQNYRMRIRVYSAVDDMGNRFFRNSWHDINAGDTPEGTFTFEQPVNESQIYRVIVRFRTFEDNNPDIYNVYEWNFLARENPELELDSTHSSSAELINGKSDYRDVKFGFLEMILKAEGLFLEADNFSLRRKSYNSRRRLQH